MSPTICLRLKRTYISFYFIQVIYTLDTNCEPHIMIPAQVIIQIPCSQSPLWLKCLSLKRGIIQLTIHKILRKVNQVTWSKQYAWYYDPSSSGSPDILLTRLLYYKRCQSRKRDIIQSNIYRNLPNVNQVIYTFDTICMPNIMVLAQAVVHIFCWFKHFFIHKSHKHIYNHQQTGFDSKLEAYNHLDRRYFLTTFHRLTMRKSKKGHNSIKYSQTFTKS